MNNGIKLFFSKIDEIIKIIESDNSLNSTFKQEFINSFRFQEISNVYQEHDSLFVELALNYNMNNFSVFFISLYNESDFKEDETYLYIGNDGGSDGNLSIDKESGEVLIYDFMNKYIISRCYSSIDNFLLKLVDSYLFFLSHSEEFIVKNIDEFIYQNIEKQYQGYFKNLILNNFDLEN